jgi:phytoene dehydrogenase-like protein
MTGVVVIGAGPNGLVAANGLADHGLPVTVFEAQAEPGGAVRSGQITLPGYEHDRFSAFYPLAAASPAIRGLALEEHGLVWRRAPLALAHPTASGPTVVLSSDIDATATSLDAFAPGDGDGWRALYRRWLHIADAFMEAFTTPFPPVRAGARLGPRGVVDLARTGLPSVRRLAAAHFRGAGGALLLTGNALHADFTPDSAGGGLFGFMLTALGQQHGFPVPEGGAGRLTDALVRRLESRGGRVVCDSRVARIAVRNGRAVGVRLADGHEEPATHGVIADTGAPQLFLDLVGREHLPARVRLGLRRFRYDHGTVKVDWALTEPIPWVDPAVRQAGTVHVGASMEALTAAAEDLERGRIPDRPFLVMGQYAAADPTRAPAGADTAWAYTHVPQGLTPDLEHLAERIEVEVERLAPGFRDRIAARHVAGPRELEAADANLVGGAINGGTAKLRQELVLRPVPGLARPETGIPGLYLGSASAHPGGGVHGAPGAIAARALLAKLR